MRPTDGSVGALVSDHGQVFEDHEPGCPLHEAVNWLRGAAMHAEALASFGELPEWPPGVPAGIPRRAAPPVDEWAVAWCTCRGGTEPPGGPG